MQQYPEQPDDIVRYIFDFLKPLKKNISEFPVSDFMDIYDLLPMKQMNTLRNICTVNKQFAERMKCEEIFEQLYKIFYYNEKVFPNLPWRTNLLYFYYNPTFYIPNIIETYQNYISEDDESDDEKEEKELESYRIYKISNTNQNVVVEHVGNTYYIVEPRFDGTQFQVERIREVPRNMITDPNEDLTSLPFHIFFGLVQDELVQYLFQDWNHEHHVMANFPGQMSPYTPVQWPERQRSPSPIRLPKRKRLIPLPMTQSEKAAYKLRDYFISNQGIVQITSPETGIIPSETNALVNSKNILKSLREDGIVIFKDNNRWYAQKK